MQYPTVGMWEVIWKGCLTCQTMVYKRGKGLDLGAEPLQKYIWVVYIFELLIRDGTRAKSYETTWESGIHSQESLPA